MKKLLIALLVVTTIFTLTACDNKKDYQEGVETVTEEEIEQEKIEANKEQSQKYQYVDDDEIIEFDDEDNVPYEEENIVVEQVINCDGCVFSYFSEKKTLGGTISKEEYTTDVATLKTMGGKQRHNFFGLVLSGNTISKAYSCILKNNKIYCIEGSVDGSHHDNNIGILNQIFTSDQCRYISNGHTYTCTDGNYNGDTQTSGYTSLHYETSCTIYGKDARTGELICH